METSTHAQRILSSRAFGFAAAAVFVAVCLADGCGGHHSSSNKYKQYSNDYGNDYSDYPDPNYPYPYPTSGSSGSSSSTSSTGSGTASGTIIGTFVNSKGELNDVVGTVDSNGVLSVVIVDTVTGAVSSGSGYTDSGGTFSVTDDSSGETDDGTVDSSDDGGDDGGDDDSGDS